MKGNKKNEAANGPQSDQGKEVTPKDKSRCSERGTLMMFDKNLVVSCVFSAFVSVAIVFIMMSATLSRYESKTQVIYENYDIIDTKIKLINDSVSNLLNSVDSIKSDRQSEKDSMSYIYTTLSSLQKDIDIVKKDLRIDQDTTEVSLKKLPSEKISFIEAFENLVKDGAPFDNFLDSYADKINMGKYKSSKPLMKFAKQSVKSNSDLKKDFDSVGFAIFKIEFSESFWEKQKRLVKEKISKAIQIKKTNEVENQETEESQRATFEFARESFFDGKLTESLERLKNLPIDEQIYVDLVENLRVRYFLKNAFEEFKEEFVKVESKVE
ncbi:MAG: hypothetical protein LBI95_03440 [Holosporales bacterium]|nr:hypothetical protein [Holosporales bacterium]